MQRPKDDEETYQLFRRLAVEDPRRAREQFLELLDRNAPELELFLQRISSPGEGRVRQLIANAVRTREGKGNLIHHLLLWREIETDEFAKRAINAALDGVDATAFKRGTTLKPLADPDLVEAYRYVADRLNHRMRNALLRPKAHIVRLREQVNEIPDDRVRAELSSLMGDLSDAFQRVGRIIDASDVGDEHFELRSVSLSDWLESMNLEYGQLYSSINLVIHNNTRTAINSLRIQASDYLLLTIFWNLWINAHQAAKACCRIDIYVTGHAKRLELLIVDNADGFAHGHVGVAFNERFSSNGAHRGRGLLEVQDAVQRLHGEVGLVEYRAGEFRIKMCFPLEGE